MRTKHAAQQWHTATAPAHHDNLGMHKQSLTAVEELLEIIMRRYDRGYTAGSSDTDWRCNVSFCFENADRHFPICGRSEEVRH